MYLHCMFFFSRDNDLLYISEGGDFCSEKEWVTLNVGGKLFTTTRMTLTAKEPFSMLSRMFSTESGQFNLSPSALDANGAYLIDRSPTYFEPILNYLRHGKLILDVGVNVQGVLEEAQFFGIESLLPQLESLADYEKSKKKQQPLTRAEVIKALVRTSPTTELRFQGVNLAEADLSKLDLRSINFKVIRHYLNFLKIYSLNGVCLQYACMHGCNLTGANLSWCNLERADLSGSKMDGAQLLGVKMLCATLEGASLRSCNFEDPAGSRANMEGRCPFFIILGKFIDF